MNRLGRTLALALCAFAASGIAAAFGVNGPGAPSPKDAAAATTTASAPGKAGPKMSVAKETARWAPHKGIVKITKQHRFETVFSSDGIVVYLYDAAKKPIAVGAATGTATLTFRDGATKEVPLARDETVPAGGQERLAGKVDLSGVTTPLNVGLRMAGLAGAEPEASLTLVYHPKELQQAQARGHENRHAASGSSKRGATNTGRPTSGGSSGAHEEKGGTSAGTQTSGTKK